MPSPYRVDFFNELGKYCDLYVFFEMKSSSGRDNSWISDKYKNFTPIFLKGISYSSECAYCSSIIREYKNIKPEINIVCSALSLTGIKLINYFIKRKIDYIIEGDGAFDKSCSKIKTIIKKRVFSHAKKLFYTSEEHKRYLLRYGGRESRLIKYPFSSIKESEIVSSDQKSADKEKVRAELNLSENSFIFLTVGRFLDWKNMETIIKAFGKSKITNSKLLIIGGQPTKSYKKIIEEYKIENIVFLPFMPKEEVFKYMIASDCFVFASLSDVWGLVINEAIANGLPVISSTTTLSSVELKANGAKISLFNGTDAERLSKLMIDYRNKSEDEIRNIEDTNIETAHKFTIETMATGHIKELIKNSF